jgi:hypothetical protein
VSDQLLVVSFNSKLLIVFHYSFSNHIVGFGLERSLLVCSVLAILVMNVIRVIKPHVVDSMPHWNFISAKSTKENVHIVIFSEVVLRDIELEAWLQVLLASHYILKVERELLILDAQEKGLVFELHSALVCIRRVYQLVLLVSEVALDRVESWWVINFYFVCVPDYILLDMDESTVKHVVQVLTIFESTLHGVVSQNKHSKVGRSKARLHFVVDREVNLNFKVRKVESLKK